MELKSGTTAINRKHMSEASTRMQFTTARSLVIMLFFPIGWLELFTSSIWSKKFVRQTLLSLQLIVAGPFAMPFFISKTMCKFLIGLSFCEFYNPA